VPVGQQHPLQQDHLVPLGDAQFGGQLGGHRFPLGANQPTAGATACSLNPSV